MVILIEKVSELQSKITLVKGMTSDKAKELLGLPAEYSEWAFFDDAGLQGLCNADAGFLQKTT